MNNELKDLLIASLVECGRRNEERPTFASRQAIEAICDAIEYAGGMDAEAFQVRLGRRVSARLREFARWARVG